MALTPAYLSELKKNVNTPDKILAITFTNGTIKWFGFHSQFPNINPALKSISSLRNKIDVKNGFATVGKLTAVIAGSGNFRNMIRDQYLKNRRVVLLEGFVFSETGYAQGYGYNYGYDYGEYPGSTTSWDYADYVITFTGIISDWKRNGDDLALSISDDMESSSKKIPEEDDTGDPILQMIDYSNMNPADIMEDILSTQLGIPSQYVDGGAGGKFETERDKWLQGFVFQRVLVTPEPAKTHLNELQIATDSFIFHDGLKLTYKVFMPLTPEDALLGLATKEFTDEKSIMENSVKQRSGYNEFFNRVIFYYDYDESGNAGSENFESVYIAIDATSQSAAQWDEKRGKVIKSKWIKSLTFTQPVDANVKIYHVSKPNGTGTGTIKHLGNLTSAVNVTQNSAIVTGWSLFLDEVFDDDTITILGVEYTVKSVESNTSMTLTTVYAGLDAVSVPASISEKIYWKAPGSSDYGKGIKIEGDGLYDAYDTDTNKYIRVVVNAVAPGTTAIENITMTALASTAIAKAIADRLLNRGRNPKSIVDFSVDMNDAIINDEFIKPADYISMTTVDASALGVNAFSKEQMMVLSVRPDAKKNTVKISAIQAQFNTRSGFIAPSTNVNDWDSASVNEKLYAFIADINDYLGAANEPPFLII